MKEVKPSRLGKNLAAAPERDATVFVVDDDESMRKSLRFLINGVGYSVETFGSAAKFLEGYDPERPGCVLLDIRMRDMSGLELQQVLRDERIDVPVIMITGYADVQTAVRAMKLGAVDFIEKPFNDEVLLGMINKAIELDRKRRAARAQQQVLAERRKKLTKREIEVMGFVVEGLSSKEIAERLDVSFKTIEAHRAKIMKKMQAKSVPHLIHMYLSLHKPAVTNGSLGSP